MIILWRALTFGKIDFLSYFNDLHAHAMVTTFKGLKNWFETGFASSFSSSPLLLPPYFMREEKMGKNN